MQVFNYSLRNSIFPQYLQVPFFFFSFPFGMQLIWNMQLNNMAQKNTTLPEVVPITHTCKCISGVSRDGLICRELPHGLVAAQTGAPPLVSDEEEGRNSCVSHS